MVLQGPVVLRNPESLKELTLAQGVFQQFGREALVKEFTLSEYKKETPLFTMYPYYVDLIQAP